MKLIIDQSERAHWFRYYIENRKTNDGQFVIAFHDDSNEYKFIHVPRSISGEKKNIFDDRWVFNIFPAKVWAGEELIFTKLYCVPQMKAELIFL